MRRLPEGANNRLSKYNEASNRLNKDFDDFIKTTKERRAELDARKELLKVERNELLEILNNLVLRLPVGFTFINTEGFSVKILHYVKIEYDESHRNVTYWIKIGDEQKAASLDDIFAMFPYAQELKAYADDDANQVTEVFDMKRQILDTVNYRYECEVCELILMWLFEDEDSYDCALDRFGSSSTFKSIEDNNALNETDHD